MVPKARFAVLGLALTLAPFPPAAAPAADEPPAAEGPLVRLLRSGKVPEERQATIVEMIGSRGNPADLAYLYAQALRADGLPAPVRLQALRALSSAELDRKRRPPGDLSAIQELIQPPAGQVDPAVQLEAIRLAGAWRVAAVGDALAEIARSDAASLPVRAAAINALSSIGGPAPRAAIEALAAPGHSGEVRVLAVAALARIDPKAALPPALRVLEDLAKGGADPAPMLAVLLSRRDGADQLAGAIRERGLSRDAARLALRSMYALGRTDPALVDTLTEKGGLNAEVQPLDAQAMQALVAEVAAKGDPARGERVFRRKDLNCMQCHAVSGAGGNVGPDLSAVGSSSPVDYLVNSIMLPDQAIKEQYGTLVVQTEDGHVYHGIVADKGADRLVLREATGETRSIPTAEIEAQKDGGSLMPKGLVNFLTRAEFVDLVRFLSELGKPGHYAIRSTPTLQRWRVLAPVPEALAGPMVESIAYRSEVIESDPARWSPAYGMVDGTLPLDEVAAQCGSPVVVVRGELDVSAAGRVTFRLDAADGVLAWVDDKAAPGGAEFTVELPAGRHNLTLRVDTRARKEPGLRVEVVKGAPGPAEFSVVGGR